MHYNGHNTHNRNNHNHNHICTCNHNLKPWLLPLCKVVIDSITFALNLCLKCSLTFLHHNYSIMSPFINLFFYEFIFYRISSLFFNQCLRPLYLLSLVIKKKKKRRMLALSLLSLILIFGLCVFTNILIYSFVRWWHRLLLLGLIPQEHISWQVMGYSWG